MGLRTWLGLNKSAHTRKAERLYAGRFGAPKIVERDGYRLLRYGKDDSFDYSAYRTIQSLANGGKLHVVSVQEENIGHLVSYLSKAGIRPRSILCHGTRNAAEQKMFKTFLPDAAILGTEIADTATRFPMTIQWDFHDVKPEWVGAYDLVFSNAWDHSYDPDRLFSAWLSCVAPGGALAVEWSEVYSWSPGVVDPFRASLDGLKQLLVKHGSPLGFVPPTCVSDLPLSKRSRCFVVTRRIPAG